MRAEEEEAMEIMMVFAKDGCKIMDSGGKDSTVLKWIAEKCREKYGMEYTIHHNHTTLDAPETVYFIRRERERAIRLGVDFQIHYPRLTFEQLCMQKQMLPTRLVRFCCEYLKESYGNRERVVTGVRKDESTARKRNQGIATIMPDKSNKMSDNKLDEIKDNSDFKITDKGGAVLLNYDNDESVELVYTCFRTNKILVNPLINWTDDDVWRCINDNQLPINPLYECGYNRVGCIGCPMSQYKGRVKDFERYPKYKDRFIRLADKLVEQMRQRRSDVKYKDGKDYFRKWIEDPNVPGQFSFDFDGNITEDYA